MSRKTLPILYLNMSGEMLYILAQRLQAQNVSKDKASKVLNDIIGTVFSEKLLAELFKGQEAHSKRAMRALFDKLAHTSIMRLNTTSMDKLFDLMTMAVKYQLQACRTPQEILALTLNHLDGIRPHVNETHGGLIENAYHYVMDTYGHMNLVQLNILRASLLHFYQLSRVKVSILLREMKQNSDGRFVIPLSGKLGHKVRSPGKIQIYTSPDSAKLVIIATNTDYTETVEKLNLNMIPDKGGRGTDLGSNMYLDRKELEIQGGTGFSRNELKATTNPKILNSSAKEEMQLLEFLIRPPEQVDKTAQLMLNFFDSPEDEENFKTHVKQEEIEQERIVRISTNKTQLSFEDMTISEEKPAGARKDKGQELLDLMDDA